MIWATSCREVKWSSTNARWSRARTDQGQMIRRQDDDLLVWPRTAAFKLLAGTSAAVDWIAGLTTAIGDRRTQPPGHTPTGT